VDGSHCRSAWPKTPHVRIGSVAGVAIWNRDIDRSAPEAVLRELALRTATPYERVEAMTLRAYESYVFENLAANAPLLLPVGFTIVRAGSSASNVA